jgi:hypothetical protein
VSGITVWSILTLRDGKEPFATSELTAFRTAKPSAKVVTQAKAIRQWWAAASADPRYHLPGR